MLGVGQLAYMPEADAVPINSSATAGGISGLPGNVIDIYYSTVIPTYKALFIRTGTLGSSTVTMYNFGVEGTAESYEVNGDKILIHYSNGKTYEFDTTNIPATGNLPEYIAPPTAPTTTVTDDQQKSPVETRAASVTLLNIGSDFMATQGFEQAANAVALEMAQVQKEGGPEALKVGFTPFAAIGGASLRVNSGSHVDIKSWGINVGFAREVANAQGKLLFGPVVEYGSGSYDSYVNAVSASGNSSFYGLGMLARQQNNDGLYYEGSLRFGRAKSDYSSGGQCYDSSSNYLAGHFGLGKVFAVSKQNTLDTYLKYFYTHQNSDTVTFAEHRWNLMRWTAIVCASAPG